MKNYGESVKITFIRRCCWCDKKHLIGPDGNAIPGPAEDGQEPEGHLFTDGMCNIAEKRFDEEMTSIEQGKKK